MAIKHQLNNLRSTITRKNTAIRGLENKRTKNTRNLTSIKILRDERAMLEEELADIINHQNIAARDGAISTLHLIMGGLKELKKAYDEGNTKESKLSRKLSLWAFIQALESRCGGEVNHKSSGTYQTNRKGHDLPRELGQAHHGHDGPLHHRMMYGSG